MIELLESLPWYVLAATGVCGVVLYVLASGWVNSLLKSLYLRSLSACELCDGKMLDNCFLHNVLWKAGLLFGSILWPAIPVAWVIWGLLRVGCELFTIGSQTRREQRLRCRDDIVAAHGGVMTINEVRAKAGYDPVPGGGWNSGSAGPISSVFAFLKRCRIGLTIVAVICLLVLMIALVYRQHQQCQLKETEEIRIKHEVTRIEGVVDRVHSVEVLRGGFFKAIVQFKNGTQVAWSAKILPAPGNRVRVCAHGHGHIMEPGTVNE